MEFQQRYEFDPKTDLLGKGGFSKVYKATDTLLERTVALKFFTGSISEKYQVLNEIRTVIRFEHPNLCKYYDVAVLTNVNVFGETERIEVGIMEYIDSGDFKTYTRKNPQHVDKLLIDVLKGLAFLHRHGIAHRDLKPQNILVKTDEEVPISKITDFGISKVIASEDTHSSALLGTIEYMAPEQFNPKKYGINGRITTNLDLWSFGLLVYEAVCHESLFGSRSGGISAEQVMANILSEASLAKADTMPAKYREIVKRCLVKHASERVQNALELIPLFENKIIPTEDPRTKEAHKSHEMSAEVTQFINPELPVQEGTQDTHATQEITAEETQVIDLGPENSIEDTQVIDAAPYATSAETQAIEQTPDTTTDTRVIEPVSEPDITETRVLESQWPVTAEITQVIEPVSEPDITETRVLESQWPVTAEITQVIEPVSDARKEPTEVINRKDTNPVVQRNIVNEQPDSNKKEVVKARPVKKVIALSSLALLLVIVFMAYPYLSQPDPSPEPPPVGATSPKNPVLPVEDWRPELIPVRGGTFTMGDMDASAVSSAMPHQVTLSNFSLGKYEITVAQFKKFIDETGYKTTAQLKGFSQIFVKRKWINGGGVDWRYDVRGNLINSDIKNIPVVHVSWRDANAYCKWLSEKTNETYRLPTEAEWEFTARGGDNSKQYSFSGSDTINQVAWYQKNSDSSIHLIGTKKFNELGIYDMSGNAFEWCNDWYNKDYYKISPIENPEGPQSPATDSAKVLRGGAWAYDGKVSRNVHRTKLKADVTGGSTGFRVCKVNK